MASDRTIRRWIYDGQLVVQKNSRGHYVFSQENLDRITELYTHGSYVKIDRTVIAVANNKGGVGKTTTAANLSYEWQHLGYKVLAVDVDPQANLTDTTTINDRRESLYNFVRGEIQITDLIKQTEHYDVLVSDLSLSELEIESHTVPGLIDSLANALSELQQYDIIVIDTPPSLSILTRMALVAADHVIVPVQASFLAMEGMLNLERQMQLLSKAKDGNVPVLGVVLTMYDQRLSMSRAVRSLIHEERKNIVCDTMIRRNTALDEAQSLKQPVSVYSPLSYGAVDYSNLAIELIHRVKEKQE